MAIGGAALTWQNRQVLREICIDVYPSTTNPTQTPPGWNPGLRGVRPMTGTAFVLKKFTCPDSNK